MSSGTDITERKNFEDKIKDKEKQLSDFFESANEIIQSINDKGRFVFVNKKWCEMLGYSKKEANEMKFTEVLKHDQINHCVKIFKEMLSGKKFENIETVFVSKNKKEIVVSGNVSPKFENGKFIYTIGIFHDITEQKKIEDYEKKHIEELKQMNRLMIGRELKMVELKKEITKLKNNHNYNLEISNHEK